MRKFLVSAALMASIALVPSIASAHGGWHGNGGARINGWGIAGLAILAGAVVYNVANTHVECAFYWNGYQNVRQCRRVPNQPVQPAPTVASDNAPTAACQAAMNTGDSDKIGQYCN